MFEKNVVKEITAVSKSISSVMLTFGIPFSFVSWSEHYQKSSACLEDLRKNVNSISEMSNQPNFTSIELINHARQNYEKWCLRCEELESTDIGNVRQEELLKIMKEPHQDYFLLLAMNSSSNRAKCLFGDVGIDLGVSFSCFYLTRPKGHYIL